MPHNAAPRCTATQRVQCEHSYWIPCIWLFRHMPQRNAPHTVRTNLKSYACRVVDTTGLIDSSGLKFYYTKMLRSHDAGIMELGLEYTDKMALPPGLPLWKLVGYCIPECTRVVSDQRHYRDVKKSLGLPSFFGFVRITLRSTVRFGFVTNVSNICRDALASSKTRSRIGLTSLVTWILCLRRSLFQCNGNWICVAEPSV